MEKYKVIRFSSKHWKPGTDVVNLLARMLKGKVVDGDIVVLSEKALMVAFGQIFDESKIKPSIFTKIFTYLWMRIVWGWILGYVCRLKPSTIQWLKTYPLREGSTHKQLTLKTVGLLQTLKPTSEGGIDGSNLPYNLVVLPMKNLQTKTVYLKNKLAEKLGVNLTVMVVDSDRTYILRSKKISLKLSTRKTCYKEILNMGFLAYLIGRMFKQFFKPNATPLTIAGEKLPVEKALIIAEIADRVRGFGAGRTVFEMAKNLNTTIDGVTWKMLGKIKHYPVVVVRRTC